MTPGRQIKPEEQKQSRIQIEYPCLFKALRGFKRLSITEATVFVGILEKRKVNAADVKEILQENEVKSTTTKPYALLKTLTSVGLIIAERANGKNNLYAAIHPRDLLLDLKAEIKQLDGEVGKIESQEPTAETVQEHTGIFDTDYAITSATSDLLGKKYTLDFCYNDISLKSTDALFKRIEERFTLKGRKAKISAIIARKPGDTFAPIIILLFSVEQNGRKQQVMAQKIVDKETCMVIIEAAK